VRHAEAWQELLATRGRAIIAGWHEALGLAAWHFRNTGFHTLTSYSFDGELITRVVECFGLNALRGSSSRGGSEALVQLERALELVEAVGLTLDGPRGPRRVAKPGIAILSARSGVPIIPVAFGVNRGWRLKSWDRFLIPKPFARIACTYGKPIPSPENSSPPAIEATRVRVEEELNRLHDELEHDTAAPPAE
jgi:lysophospholipid acyltransferase (LPLAT)-like uncharacterized protein